MKDHLTTSEKTAWAMRQTGCGSRAKLLLIVMADKTDEYGVWWRKDQVDGMREIANVCDCTMKQLIRACDRLEALGLLSWYHVGRGDVILQIRPRG